MIDLTAPEALRIAVALIALTLVALGLYIRRRRRAAAALGDRALIRQLLGVDLGRAPIVRLATIAGGAGLIAGAIVGAAGPAAQPGARGPVVLLLDASASMLVADAGGTRLEAQRRAAREIVDRLDASAVGVVAFAGRAFSLTPPTRDRAAVDMYISTVDPTIVTGSGSALNAAIRQGIGLLASSGSSDGGTLVLLGDGDETADRDAAVEAATLARRAGVRIHTVAVGSAAGGPVPALDPVTATTEGYLLAPDGAIIESRTDDGLLREISSRTGGLHVAASDPEATHALANRIAGTADPAAPWSAPWHAWLALAALVLLMIEPIAESVHVARSSSAVSRGSGWLGRGGIGGGR